MSSGAFLSSIAVGLIQWWVWCVGLTLLLAVAVKAAGERRPAVHDLLCRALVALELALFPASLALSLTDMPPAPQAVSVRPSGGMASRPAVAPPPAPELPGTAIIPAPPSPRPVEVVPVATAPSKPARGSIELGLPSWAAAAIIAVYLVGVTVGLSMLARRLRRSAELVESATATLPERILQSFRAAEQRMGARRPVRLALTERATVPLLVGWRRPAILLPAALAERLSPAVLEPLLAHELAHHARRDVPWKLAEAIATALAWPVPLQRWTGRAMARAAEVLCDRMAAGDARGREVYARALYEVLAADRSSPLAFGAPAMGSKSFLRRRIEIVLAAEPIAPRLPVARRLTLVLVALAAALPVVAVRLSAAGQTEPRLAAPAPVIQTASAPSSPGDDTPEPIRRVQAELKNLLRKQAVEDHAAGHHDQAADRLRRAHELGRELGASAVELIPLGGTMGALDLGGAASPFVSWIIEKKFGPLLRIDPGHVAGAKEGVLVQELGVLEKIHEDLFSAPQDKMVSFQMRLLRLDADEAARWARILREDRNESLEWSHPLTTEESARLEARIQEIRGAKDAVSSLEYTPILTSFDGMSASIMIYTQRSYIEKYELVARGDTRVANPVVGSFNEGLELECFQRILAGGRVRALFRATRTHLKGFQEVLIDLPPWAQRVPIQIPVIQKDVTFHDAIIAEGDGTILASAPAEREEKLHGPLERSWIWVKCQVIGE